MPKEFVEEPLASPGSAKYLICNFVETQGLFKQVVKQLFKKWKLICHKAGQRPERVSEGQLRVSEGWEHCHDTLQPTHTEGDGRQEIVII